MAREFVRKIRNVSTIQELRDWTNCMGDIVIKDEIYAYIRVAGEYKPISYPMIYDYKLPKEQWTHGDYWLNREGVHRRDSKINTKLKYDLINGIITASIATDDKNNGVINFDHSLFSQRLVTEDDNGDSASLFNQSPSNIYSERIVRDKNTGNNSGVTVDQNSDRVSYDISVDSLELNWSGSNNGNLNIQLIPESNSINLYDTNNNEYRIYQGNNGSLIEQHNGDASVKSQVMHEIVKFDVIADASKPSLLSVENLSDNGIQIGTDYGNQPILSFILNNQKLDFSMNRSNNTDHFVISGSDSYKEAFRQAIDSLLGFTTTIESLRQEISSLKSRVSSLESRP